MSSNIAISVRGLSKVYEISRNEVKHNTMAEQLLHRLRHPFQRAERERFSALRDVSFDVNEGDVVGVIGRNGAGKSTLLKILSRITEPTTGEAVLHGRVGSLLEVGTGFHPELTGRENIYLNGQILGMRKKEIDDAFDAIVDFAGVAQFLNTPVKRYSSGMYVRLAFAVAAHLNPEILVVDEVLAVGDAEFQKKCLGTMENVARSGRTVLFVSHNESAVRRLCKRAILLRQGQVECIGTPAEAFSKYRANRDEDGFSAINRTHSSEHFEIVDAYLSFDGIRTTDLIVGTRPVLTYVVKVKSNIKFSLELILRDANSAPVLFAPVGLAKGVDYQLQPGRYLMSYELELPVMAEGKYSLDLMVVESNIKFYDYLEEALTFQVSPSNNANTGWSFRQSMAQGFALLGVNEVEVRPDNGRLMEDVERSVLQV
ncbi:MAG: polysaccharide ABC transporter ATP-binding protein [Planctomycetota bacterium]|nr:polysaccharide ABC transporter ATP-binding protein [Planctomycetota bacterium]